MDSFSDKIAYLICLLPALVLGLTIHEFAHAWAGWRLGDDTPRRMGRLTLDPMAHIDPFGALFFILSAFAGFGLGWAKPVPINPRNLNNPRRDSMLVALAGPASNLLQMPIWLLFFFGFGVLSRMQGWLPDIDLFDGTNLVSLISRALMAGVVTNIGLAAFNMMPLPPLDGHYVLEYLGGPQITDFFNAIRPYSFFILIIIINFTPLFRMALSPIYSFAYSLAIQAFVAGAGA